MKRSHALMQELLRRVPALSFLVELVQVFVDRRVSRSAAELSYYLTLTLFPMLIVVIDVLGRLPLDTAAVVGTISEVLPADTASLVGSYLFYVQHHQSTTMLAGAILTIMIAASAGFRGLMGISEEIYGRDVFTSLWGVVLSFVFSVLMVLMVYLSFAVVLTGNWFLHFLRENLPFVAIPDHWPRMRLLLMFAVAMLVLSLLYWLMGPKGLGRPMTRYGAFLGASLLTLGTNVFSSLIGFSSRYSMVYGSLASIIVLMMWLFFCGNIVILGMVFNYVVWRRSGGTQPEEEE